MQWRKRELALPAVEGARLAVLALVGEARTAAARLEEGRGEEPLHDFRVALRRLRSLLRSFRALLGGTVGPRHRRRLRRLARSTSGARDAEVQLEWLEALGRARPRSVRPQALERVAAHLREAAREGPAPARTARRFRRAARKLVRRLRGPAAREAVSAPASLAEALAPMLRDQVAALRGRLAAIRGPADAAALHRTRIEAKRLRYLLEPLAGLRRAGARESIERLKGLQAQLGELHDLHVLSATLRGILEDPAARAAGVDAVARAARARGAAVWARLSRERSRGGFRELEARVAAVAERLTPTRS